MFLKFYFGRINGILLKSLKKNRLKIFCVTSNFNDSQEFFQKEIKLNYKYQYNLSKNFVNFEENIL